MSTFQYRSGLGNSAAYQVSGIPYILRGTTTAKVDEVKFDSVTNWIQISASADMQVGFSLAGATKDHYFVASAGLTDVYYWRVSSIFVTGSGGGTGGAVDYEIRAGVTTISSTELTTNWSGSAGVG